MRFLDGAIKVMQRPVGPVLLVALMVSALVAATVGFVWRWVGLAAFLAVATTLGVLSWRAGPPRAS